MGRELIKLRLLKNLMALQKFYMLSFPTHFVRKPSDLSCASTVRDTEPGLIAADGKKEAASAIGPVPTDFLLRYDVWVITPFRQLCNIFTDAIFIFICTKYV